ncbi:MAG: hypothetical protein WDN06_15180 [Asticcacaulis sp.]
MAGAREWNRHSLDAQDHIQSRHSFNTGLKVLQDVLADTEAMAEPVSVVAPEPHRIEDRTAGRLGITVVKHRQFAFAPHLLRQVIVAPARLTFLVQQGSLRRIDHFQAARPRFQTQVDVIERDGESLLIEAAKRIEQRASDHQAGAGDGIDLSGRGDQRMLAPLSLSHAAPRMTRSRDQVRRHAGVLKVARRVQQAGADDTHIRTGREGEHGAEPVAVQRLNVVIEEQQRIVPGLAGAKIAQFGEVERRVVADDANVGPGRKPLQARQHGRVGRAIVDDDDVLHNRAQAKRGHAGRHKIGMGLGRDDDGDRRFWRDSGRRQGRPGRNGQGCGFPGGPQSSTPLRLAATGATPARRRRTSQRAAVSTHRRSWRHRNQAGL